VISARWRSKVTVGSENSGEKKCDLEPRYNLDFHRIKPAWVRLYVIPISQILEKKFEVFRRYGDI
jgi:hypothetical protein